MQGLGARDQCHAGARAQALIGRLRLTLDQCVRLLLLLLPLIVLIYGFLPW